MSWSLLVMKAVEDRVWPEWRAAIEATAVFLVTFLPWLGRGFIKDDFAWIASNQVTSPGELVGLFTSTADFYRPVVRLSFAADWWLFGIEPLAYGLTNLAILAAGALALRALALALGMPRGAALLAAGLWAFNFHGVDMSLLWISGRTSLLATLFAFLAARSFVVGRPRAAAGWALVAMLSKEDAVLLPFVLLAWGGLWETHPRGAGGGAAVDRGAGGGFPPTRAGSKTATAAEAAVDRGAGGGFPPTRAGSKTATSAEAAVDRGARGGFPPTRAGSKTATAAEAAVDRGAGGGFHFRRALRSSWPLFVSLGLYLAARTAAGAMTPLDAPDAYRFVLSPGPILLNAVSYLDRGATLGASFLLVLAAAAWAVPRPTAVERRWVLLGVVWLLGGFAIALLLPFRSSLYAVGPAAGASLAGAALVSALWNGVGRAARCRAVLAGAGALAIAVPIHWARIDHLVDSAKLSTHVLDRLAPVVETLPPDGVIRLDDDRGRRNNLDAAFGTLVETAVLVRTGRPQPVWIEPPPVDWRVAGLVPPRAEDVVVRFALRDGELVRVPEPAGTIPR